MSGIGDLFLQALLPVSSTVRLATPLVLAAIAGLFCERSCVVDIGLEGKMLGAAFAAAAAAQVTGSAWLGLAAAHRHTRASVKRRARARPSINAELSARAVLRAAAHAHPATALLDAVEIGRA